MIGRKYLIDNNTLAKLNRAQRASEFFFSHCLLPTEVLYEARGFPDARQLGRLQYPTNGRILRILGEVMATIPTDDTPLVDLYANRGNADPTLVARALNSIREAEDELFGWEWIIVSNNNAVRRKAAEFGIETLLSDQFSTLLDYRA